MDANGTLTAIREESEAQLLALQRVQEHLESGEIVPARAIVDFMVSLLTARVNHEDAYDILKAVGWERLQ